MHIQSITLENFRCFEKLSLALHPRLNVFFGENGAGKSAVLNAIQLLLGQLVQRITKREDITLKLKMTDTLHSKTQSKLNISMEFDKVISWHMTGSINMVREVFDPVEDSSELDGKFNKPYYEQLPIVASYMTGRTALNCFSEELDNFNFDARSSYIDALSYGDCFRPFLSWFKEREDLENERLLNQLRLNDGMKLGVGLEYDKQLKAIKNALANFFERFSNFTYDRKKRTLVAKKDGELHDLSQLSDGERGYILLVGDIARRLAIANPGLDNPLEGEGVILIDEIELHLHPKWQRMVIPKLLETFPNCQFIVTSHSPQVLGEIEDTKSIWILEEGAEPYHPSRAYGMESSELLREVMGVESRNKWVTEKLERIEALIDDEKFDAAKVAIKELVKKTGKIPDIYGLNASLTMAGQDQVELED